MELKEYLKIIKANRRVFSLTIAIFVAGAILYIFLKPVSYTTSLTLSITRTGVQQTADYKYDDFYRLQADEKFADTIVEWLSSPRVASDIYSKAGINPDIFSLKQLAKVFTGEKRSSQIVAVSFAAGDAQTAKKISQAIVDSISENAAALNRDQQENTWFKIIGQAPVIIQDRTNSLIVLLLALVAGIFIGFFAALLAHYIK